MDITKPDPVLVSLLTHHVYKQTPLCVTVRTMPRTIAGRATWPVGALPVPDQVISIGVQSVIVALITCLVDARTKAVLWQK